MSSTPLADDSSSESGDERAEKACGRALELDPRLAATVHDAGARRAGIGDEELAMQWFQQALSMRLHGKTAGDDPPERLSEEIG